MSIDYMKSGRLAVNVLIELCNLKIDSQATFNFISKTISPIEAGTKESRQLLNDYLNWLPDHFSRHNCDLNKLEKLEITIWANFDMAKTPIGMSNCKEFTVYTKTIWKAGQRKEGKIEISQTEIVKENYLKQGIPEF
ncbi:MAG: hypothetical protein ACXVJB_00630 [Mucilaginibacter sp.]